MYSRCASAKAQITSLVLISARPTLFSVSEPPLDSAQTSRYPLINNHRPFDNCTTVFYALGHSIYSSGIAACVGFFRNSNRRARSVPKHHRGGLDDSSESGATLPSTAPRAVGRCPQLHRRAACGRGTTTGEYGTSGA
jgi:hypothetical protein